MSKNKYQIIVQEYNYKCASCDTRHPTQLEKCFFCGKNDMIVFDQIKIKEKKKSKTKGATLTINL